MALNTFLTIAGILIVGSAVISPANCESNMTLFDFTTLENLDDWTEQSDVMRTTGKSKAVIALQVTEEFQRAVFFSLLNLQSDGTAFAGVRTNTTLDLSYYENIEIDCRAQGSNSHYKFVLRDNGNYNDSSPTYEQFFIVPISADDFSTISVPLANFSAYFRGSAVSDADALDLSSITNFEIQMSGGLADDYKQSGVSSLEINTIIAV